MIETFGLNCFVWMHFYLACFRFTVSVGLTLLLGSLSAAHALTPVSLQLKWSHAFQFAGYYAAQQKGYYREAGLLVDIREAKPELDVVQSVVSGQANYGVGNSSLLLARQRGEPVVALGVIFQHSPLVLIARSNQADQTIHALAGKRIMIEPQSDELLAFLTHEGLPAGQFDQVAHSHNPQDLIDGKVDAMSAYVTYEPFFLDRKGLVYQTYTPRSAGIDFYGDNLFTTEGEISNNPGQVEAFQKASLRGWQYAMDHPEEMADLIIAKYAGQLPREFYLFEAQHMVPLMQTDLIQVGYMNPVRWRQIANTYAQLGLLPRDVSLDGFLYTTKPKVDWTRVYVLLALLLLASLTVLYILRSNRRLKSALASSQDAQRALGVSEERHRLLADNAADVIWTMDLRGRLTFVSPSIEKLRGYTSAEAMRQRLDQIVGPSSIDLARENLDRLTAAMAAGLPFPEFREELEQICKNGTTVWTEVRTCIISDASGQYVGALGVTRDITERKKLEAEVLQLAFHDPLTKLPNRRLFQDRLSQSLAWAQRTQSRVALLFIDLDKFKPINDQHGHAAGDRVLESAARRMEGCLRASDTAARIGGDEILVLLPDIGGRDDALAVAEKIRVELEQPFVISGQLSLRTSASIGVAICPDHATTEQDLMRLGDLAMYEAKSSGGNRVKLCAVIAEPDRDDDIRSAAKSIVRLNWKAVFDCGEASIDDEHRELFRLSNVLLGRFVTRAEEPDQFLAVFDTLLEYVVRHFAHEEEILKAHGYEHLDEHARLHQTLVQQAQKLRYQVHQPTSVSLGDLIDFLVTEVIARHILTEDRKFAACFGVADVKSRVD